VKPKGDAVWSQSGAVRTGKGQGFTQVRFELGYYALKPDIKVIAPWRAGLHHAIAAGIRAWSITRSPSLRIKRV
jgi:argininosuccinate synthase